MAAEVSEQAPMSAMDEFRPRSEIAELNACYVRSTGMTCREDPAQLFPDDSAFGATKTSGENSTGPAAAAGSRVNGRDAIVDYVSRESLDHVRSVHTGFIPEISLLSGTELRAVCAMERRVWLPDDPIAFMHSFGHYHDAHIRREGL
jgi:hypothetical protein